MNYRGLVHLEPPPPKHSYSVKIPEISFTCCEVSLGVVEIYKEDLPVDSFGLSHNVAGSHERIPEPELESTW